MRQASDPLCRLQPMSLGYLLAQILLLLPEEIQLCEREAGGKLHRAQVPGHQQHLRAQLFPLGWEKEKSTS
jgi:hypothetical protein